MMWESYPIVWMMLGLVAVVVLLKWVFRLSHRYIIIKARDQQYGYGHKWLITAAIVFGLMVYGSISSQPLKWNNAFQLEDGFRSNLALNPLQNFFTTLKFRKPENNSSRAKQYLPVMKSWMGLPVSQDHFRRVVQPAVIRQNKPNVVLVLCESFSMYKSSMSGNPLNTTPYFQQLADNGVFYNRCFSPHFSTARGLFATVTGIPDVQLSKFSTRNPEALDQHTILNNLDGYRKMYFLGGSPEFNNFAGLLKNIEGLEMVTEGQFRSKPVNVWGISDKDLFLEANETFAKQTAPFFAIVQTADNHRPFHIPENETEFRKKQVHADTLKKYGFETIEEFNAFRYADFAIEKFMEAASKEKYFENTLFVFVGDHGVCGNAKAIYGDTWTKKRLTEEHIPLLFYSPSMIQPELRDEVVSQVDVLPSIFSVIGQPYVNTTLGRDVLMTRNPNNYAFIIHHDKGQIGMVTNEYYFTKNLNFDKEEISFFNEGSYTQSQIDSVVSQVSLATSAYYETAKWMLLNNKKPKQDFNKSLSPSFASN
jgi:phosphoglycerol transferase MdoB-like AlkP superfamily enzyme